MRVDYNAENDLWDLGLTDIEIIHLRILLERERLRLLKKGGIKEEHLKEEYPILTLLDLLP